MVIDFDKIHKEYSSAEEIKKELDKNPKGFIFRSKIYRARYYSDLAQDCLEAAFIGQQLSDYSERIDVKKESEYMHDTIIEFSLKPNDSDSLSKLIFNYGQIYSGKDEDISHEFMQNLNEYRERLDQINHAFPELVDDYYANYINGEYYEYDPINNKDFFENEFSRFPERKYGFVKSAYSKKIDHNFYTSIDSVIIPNSSDPNLILKEYSGLENLNFIKAEFFAIGNIAYIVSNGFIIHFPFDSFIKAKQCAWEALEPKEETYEEDGRWLNGLLSFNRMYAKYNEKENLRGYPDDLSEQLILPMQGNPKENFEFVDPNVICFYISSYGDHLLVRDTKYSYFFFGTDKLIISELGFLENRLSLLFNTTANLAGIHVEIKCPWVQLNDETFEDLCFDIIYHNPKFDNSTIRKMGKTRSRDGGRDIVVSTHSRPGKTSQKYIFQCKYLQPGSSLSASKVLDISDTVTQYGASGYGIMTNVVIDATLYDKMDGIAKNMNIETEDYSVYKFERILACYPQIKQRYFKK